jgi:integrase
MTGTRITAKALEALKPPSSGRLELTDSDVPGLKFRLTSKGAASWSLQVNVHGEKRRFTLGEYPVLGLAKARAKAAALREQAKQGYDPIRERRSAQASTAHELMTRVTVFDAIERYAATHLRPNLRTAVERERQLRAALKPHAEKSIGDITRFDLQAAIDAKATEGRVGAANRIRAALMHFSRWCWERGYLAEHTAAASTRAAREKARERVLSLSEVRLIYEQASCLGPLWMPFVRLLVLTAQRRGDVAGMLWEELDQAACRWSIPGYRAKNGKAHIVHLSRPAVQMLTAMHKDVGSPLRGLIFTTTGTTPVSGFGRVKLRLDQSLSQARIAAGRDEGNADLEPWRFHDLRTAFASALCEAGEPESVVDRVLNHAATGSAPSAVARVYNRAMLLEPRARVLDRWAMMIAVGAGIDQIAEAS